MKLIDLTLRNVPDACVVEVKKLAAVAVDRYYHKSNEVVSEVTLEASNLLKDAFRTDNDLSKKWNPDPPTEEF